MYSYISITFESMPPANHYVYKNWVNSKKTTFLKKHILARGAFLLLTTTSFITCALDTIIGLGAAIGVIYTAGKHEQILQVACAHISCSNYLIALPYTFFFTNN